MHVTLTDHLQVTDLTDHRVGVHLAHVNALVGRPHAVDVQQPRFLAVVRHAKPRYPGDHVLVHGQYHLSVDVNPSHLPNRKVYAINLEPARTFRGALVVGHLSREFINADKKMFSLVKRL